MSWQGARNLSLQVKCHRREMKRSLSENIMCLFNCSVDDCSEKGKSKQRIHKISDMTFTKSCFKRLPVDKKSRGCFCPKDQCAPEVPLPGAQILTHLVRVTNFLEEILAPWDYNSLL